MAAYLRCMEPLAWRLWGVKTGDVHQLILMWLDRAVSEHRV